MRFSTFGVRTGDLGLRITLKNCLVAMLGKGSGTYRR